MAGVVCVRRNGTHLCMADDQHQNAEPRQPSAEERRAENHDEHRAGVEDQPLELRGEIDPALEVR